MNVIKSRPAVKSSAVGGLTLIHHDSLMQVLGVDLATLPTDRPKTITKRKAQELSGLSRATIDRMIAAGRQSAA